MTLHLVFMGVSGSGKSTVARAVRDRLGWDFAEGDEFHPPENVAKMQAGHPLSDADRFPWLGSLAAWIRERDAEGRPSLMSCSALRWTYREVLRSGADEVVFVHLVGDKGTLLERMGEREHFMPPSLLESQLATIEPLREDERGIVLDVAEAPDVLARKVLAGLGLLPTPTLDTERLRLRPVEDADAEDLVALHSNAHVLRYWDSPPWTDPGRVEQFLSWSRKLEEDGSGARLVVERRSDGAFLGWCSLSEWNPDFRTASLGYCYGEAAWGQGYATEAARALLTWAFDLLDLNRVQAETDTRNLASARVLEKLGFLLEGTLREDCVVAGDVSDSWVFGLLRREWSPT